MVILVTLCGQRQAVVAEKKASLKIVVFVYRNYIAAGVNGKAYKPLFFVLYIFYGFYRVVENVAEKRVQIAFFYKG